jgi:DNA polymerase-3 subunit gamma/tau
VAEDFKQKYLQIAQKISPAFIVSALNILNEAEINYKQARNKRLHVELTIIKLSYLQQALELVNNEGAVSKKKIIEGAKTVSFRALPIVSSPILNQIASTTETQKSKPIAEAKLIIEAPKEIKKTVTQESITTKDKSFEKPATNATETKTSLGSLLSIRNKITNKNKEGDTEVKPLNEEELQSCWNLFIEKLRTNNNYSAITNFKAAALKVIDSNTIEIVTQGEIHKAFIEVERADLVTHIQDYFNNRTLVYQVAVIEKEEPAGNGEIILNRKQQYLKIIEEYPLVKELKERLKLELE